jgi:hypothetical protein
MFEFNRYNTTWASRRIRWSAPERAVWCSVASQHRSIPHGYGTPIPYASTLEMLIGRHAEMFIDPIRLEQLAIQRNYNSTRFVVVVRDKNISTVSSVANHRHARDFSDAREHMNRTSFILKSLMERNNTLVVEIMRVLYSIGIHFGSPARFSNFWQCPQSRFSRMLVIWKKMGIKSAYFPWKHIWEFLIRQVLCTGGFYLENRSEFQRANKHTRVLFRLLFKTW